MQGWIAFGPEAGRWAQRVGFDPAAVGGSPGSDRTTPSIPKKLCANDGGFSLHARVRVHACARRRLEQLCRYAARGPIAQGRLSRTSDGRVLYRFKRPFRDGTTHVVLSPTEFIERLAAQVPPPRRHMVTYHGVLAPAAGYRDQVVPEERPYRDAVHRHRRKPPSSAAGLWQAERRATRRLAARRAGARRSRRCGRSRSARAPRCPPGPLASRVCSTGSARVSAVACPWCDIAPGRARGRAVGGCGGRLALTAGLRACRAVDAPPRRPTSDGLNRPLPEPNVARLVRKPNTLGPGGTSGRGMHAPMPRTDPEARAAALIARHQADVWRYLRHLGCEASEADDLTQETFLVLLQSPFRERSRQATAAWLRRVAENHFRNSTRSRRRRQASSWIADVNAIWEEDEAPTDDRLEALADCLGTMDGRSRQMVDLFYRDGMSRRAIADRFDLQENGVKTRLQRVRLALRECVERTLSRTRSG